MFMSYCRFEGTYRELSYCLDDIVNDAELSENEAYYAKRMRDLCEEYIQAYDEQQEAQEYNEED